MAVLLPAQIEAVREPGWYFVKDEPHDDWEQWEWDGRGWTIQTDWTHRRADPDIIGPRIPDPATLQQHERLVAVADETDGGLWLLEQAIRSRDPERELLLRVADMRGRLKEVAALDAQETSQ